MGGSFFSGDAVGGAESPDGLGFFLEFGFVVVWVDVSGSDAKEVGVELFEDEPSGFFESGFEVDGPDDGFEDVAEDGGSFSSSGGFFVGADFEGVMQA